jgi:hypothetical protein
MDPSNQCHDKTVRTNKDKLRKSSKYLSSLEIKQFLKLQKNSESCDFNIQHLQTLYRFFDEKLDSIKSTDYDKYSRFNEDSLHFSISTVMNDLSILLCNDFDYISVILESLKYSFPIGSKDYIDMKNDIMLYGKHLHGSILSYFHQ